MRQNVKVGQLKNALRIARHEGSIALLIRILQKIQQKKQQTTVRKKKSVFLVDLHDVVDAEWATCPNKSSKPEKTIRTIAWVMSPPGESGGGHQNIFRFIDFLDKKGYRNHIYFYSTTDFPSVKTIRERIKGFYQLDPENAEWLKRGGTISKGDALFATGWETAYPVYNASVPVKKFYFVQDFEPLFYPMSSEYVLAENTYKFGFHGITAGKWLAQKLSQNYGMDCDYYDFGAESKLYDYTNKAERREAFFYARPITARRGFELGIITLEKFHEQHPEYVINLAGWDVSEYEIPFPYVNHKALKLSDLSELYNKCAVALVISLTNMSLLPLELLAAGAIPVVNDGQNNRLVSDNPYIEYALASPDALALAMDKIVSMKNLPHYAERASQSVANNSWRTAGEKFVEILENTTRG